MLSAPTQAIPHVLLGNGLDHAQRRSAVSAKLIELDDEERVGGFQAGSPLNDRKSLW